MRALKINHFVVTNPKRKKKRKPTFAKQTKKCMKKMCIGMHHLSESQCTWIDHRSTPKCGLNGFEKDQKSKKKI